MCICYSSTRCFKTLRCFKMNAIKLNCTLKSVTKVSAQVVLFLAVLAWCSSALKRHKTDPNPSYIPGTKACQRLGFGSWRFETQSVLRSGLSTWSPQQLLWWIGGWGSRGWSWHLSSRPMLWCHGRDWSSMACHMLWGFGPHSRVEGWGSRARSRAHDADDCAASDTPRGPSRLGKERHGKRAHRRWCRYWRAWGAPYLGEMSILHDAILIVGEQLQWTSLQLRLNTFKYFLLNYQMCTVHSLEMTLSCLGFDIIKHFTQFPVVIIRRSQSQREASTNFRPRCFHGIGLYVTYRYSMIFPKDGQW